MAEKLSLNIEVKDDGSLAKTESSLKNLQKVWMEMVAKVTAATAVVYGIGKAFSSFVNEAAEAEQIQNRLRFALETTGYQWGIAKHYVDEYASSIQETTRFSGKQARQALTDLMMYTQDFSKAQMGAKLAMDMSIRTGQDLGSTSRLIGMAMSGNVEMLGRYIPELRNLDNILGANATMAQKAEYALKILQQKFGGTAAADLDTYSAKVAQFKNAWSDLKEEIGTGLLPVLKDTFQWVTNILRAMEERRRLQKEEGGGFGPVPGMPYYTPPKTSWPSETRFRLPLVSKKDTFAEGKSDLGDVRSDANLYYEAWKEAYFAYYDELYTAQKKAHEEREFWKEEEVRWNKEQEEEKAQDIQEGLERSKDAYQEWLEDRIRMGEEEDAAIKEGIENAKLLHQAWLEEYTAVDENAKKMAETMEQIGGDIANIWSGNLKAMLTGQKSFAESFKRIWFDMAEYAISQMLKIAMNQALFGNVQGKYPGGAGLMGLVGNFLGGGGKAAAGSSYIAPISEWGSMAWLQEGGVVTRPTAAMIGENEPEAVIPLSKMGKGGGNVFMIINCVDAQSFEDRFGSSVVKIIHQDKKTAGILNFEQ